jgi:hypothetical protein
MGWACDWQEKKPLPTMALSKAFFLKDRADPGNHLITGVEGSSPAVWRTTFERYMQGVARLLV